MKLCFLIMVTAMALGKRFVSLHSSRDLMFANPPITLDQLSGYDCIRMPPELTADIKQYGKHNFTIQAIKAGPNRKSLTKDRDALIKHLKESSIPVYNRPRKQFPRFTSHPSYIPNVSNNPAKSSKNRKKAAERMKQRVIVRDSMGKIVHHYSREDWEKLQNVQLSMPHE